ncbi:XIAP-associated factor 1 isoform X3 [Trachypithecus francoisi]|uniref:XIAP-associated factor 1 isoform X3 n=1 Tax=Trachypithecus francoisi TaxID=54180 RepID=UPI00141BC6AC|nr:XIAP-associated factor 1 isoform X3 [Trachypithecus francoisi]
MRLTACGSWSCARSVRSLSPGKTWRSTARLSTSRLGVRCVSRVCRSPRWSFMRPMSARSALLSVSSANWTCSSASWSSTNPTAAAGQSSAQAVASSSHAECSRSTQMSVGVNRPSSGKGKCCPDSEFKKRFPVGKPKILPSSLPSQAAENQTSMMKKDVRPKTISINRFSLHSESSSKKAPRGNNKTLNPLLMSEPKPRTSSPRGNRTAYDILRRCSQCGILLPLPILNQHQEKCRWLASSKGKQVRNFS